MSSMYFKTLGYAIILGSALMANAVPKAGQITWYDPKNVMDGTGVGACGGEPLDQTMPIAALAKAYFDSYPGAGPNPNNNPLCGKEISVTIADKSVKVTVRDRCDSCEGAFDVDLSHSSFSELTNPDGGRLPGNWDFVNPEDDIGMKSGDDGSPPDPQNPNQPGPNPTDPTDPSHTGPFGGPGNMGPTSVGIPTATWTAPIPGGTPPGTNPPGHHGPANGNGPTDPNSEPERRNTRPLAARTVRKSNPRRMSRIMRDLVDGVGTTKRSEAKKVAEPQMRPRRLSRVMRGLVLENQN